MSKAVDRFVCRPDVPWRRSLDTVLVLPPGASEPVTLGGPAPEIWARLAVPSSLEALAKHLAATHSAALAVVRADVRRLLEQLRELALIESVVEGR